MAMIKVNTAYSENRRTSFYEWFETIERDRLPAVGELRDGATCVSLDECVPDVYNSDFVWMFDYYRAKFKDEDGEELEELYAVEKENEEADTAGLIVNALKAERIADLSQGAYLAYGDVIKHESEDESSANLDDSELYWWGDEVVPVSALGIFSTNLDSGDFREELETAIEEYGWQ